jgi:hypothetical protein
MYRCESIYTSLHCVTFTVITNVSAMIVVVVMVVVMVKDAGIPGGSSRKRAPPKTPGYPAS